MTGGKGKSRLTAKELEIIDALKSGPKSFTWLRDHVLSGPTLLSRYLKHLQREGMIERDMDTRKYRVKGLIGGEFNYAVWESTDLKDIHTTAEALDVILKAKIPPEEKTDLVARFLTASLEFMSANIALNLSEAVREKEPENMRAVVKDFLEGYVTPFVKFLAGYCWTYGSEISGWLEQIGSSIAHEARKTFNPEIIVKVAKEELSSEGVGQTWQPAC